MLSLPRWQVKAINNLMFSSFPRLSLRGCELFFSFFSLVCWKANTLWMITDDASHQFSCSCEEFFSSNETELSLSLLLLFRHYVFILLVTHLLPLSLFRSFNSHHLLSKAFAMCSTSLCAIVSHWASMVSNSERVLAQGCELLVYIAEAGAAKWETFENDPHFLAKTIAVSSQPPLPLHTEVNTQLHIH